MKYKIKNKTEVYIRYVGELFAPKEEKVLELDIIYEHRDFDIEEFRKIKKIEKKPKKKGGKR